MFLSVVINRSKPACSAAAINSPFTSRSHPRSIASTTVWPGRACRSGAGVPLSNRMSIDPFGGRRECGRVKAARREVDHCDNLLAGEMEPVHDFLNGGPRFQIIEDHGDGGPGVAEDPGAAALARYALHGRALRPIQWCHVPHLYLIVVCHADFCHGHQSARGYRCTRAPPPFIIRCTSSNVAMVVSPGVVIASAPCAQPQFTAQSAPFSFRKP